MSDAHDFEPVVGHAFTLDAGPWGQSPCKVVEVDPPHRLSFEWDKDWTITFERKVGRETRYRLDPTPLMEVKDWLGYFERFWANKMEALKLFVESENEPRD